MRRAELAAAIGADQAAQAHADLLDLPVDLWPYELLASRVWELRANLSCYDAANAALADFLGARLVRLGRRIARAAGIACAVSVPDDS